MTPADPWRGLGTEILLTRAQWLIKTPLESLCLKKNAINPM
jgi:hypothetical protein